MKITCILFIFFLTNSVIAQGIVDVKYFDFLNRIINHDVHYDVNKNNFIIISTHIDSLNKYKIQVSKVDTFGIIIDKYEILAPDTNDFIIRPGNGIFCNNLDSCYFYTNLFKGKKCALIKFDNSFTEYNISEFKWQENLKTHLSLKTVINENIHILASDAQKENGLDDYLIEILDENNNVKNHHYYGKEGFNEFLKDIIPLPNKEFLLLGSQAPPWTASIASENNKSWYYLIRIDSLGNVLQEIKGKGTKDWAPSNGVYYHDDNGEARIAFGCGRWEVDENYNAYKATNRFFILDSIGNVIKEKEFDGHCSFVSNIKKVKKVPDGFIIGSELGGDGDTDGHLIFSIMKLNNDGELVWEERFQLAKPDTGQYWANYLTGLEILPSGSIVATGNGYSTENKYFSFLMKLDKDGCLDPGCRAVATDDLERVNEDVKIYPNPSTGLINIDSPADGAMHLFSITGKKLSSYSIKKGINELNLESNDTGIYLLKIKLDSGVIFTKKLVLQR
jgi:hypothetical protein